MKTTSPKEGGQFLGTASWFDKEARNIEFPFPRLFAQLAVEYAERYGLDDAYLSRIAALNYANAKGNPKAQTRTWFMSEWHAASEGEYNPCVGGRLKVSDCSQVTDGGVAVVLASRYFAERYAQRCGRPIESIPRILGWGHTTAPMLLSEKFEASRGTEFVLPRTRQAITDALRRAEIADCWGLDAIETHDCFTSSEYMAIDHFGLTKPGESWRAIEEGVIELGGRLPINPSGGLIGAGHPVGATGVRQVLDATLQVCGNAGGYQVPGARRVGTLNLVPLFH